MKTTIKDVAREAGVSIATVSRVLNGLDRVADSTRRRVMSAADRLGYSPDLMARAMVTKETRTIGVIVPLLGNEYWAEAAEAIQSQFWRKGYDSILVSMDSQDSDKERWLSRIKNLIQRRIDGVVYCGSVGAAKADCDLVGVIEEAGLPVVCFENQELNLDSVYCNHQHGAEIAVNHLFSLGHRRIAMLGEKDLIDREMGYRKAHLVAGVEMDERLIRRIPLSPEAAEETIYDLKQRGPEFSALFCATDFTAFGAMKALLKSGLAIPGDVAVMGYDGTHFSGLFQPALSTIVQPLASMVAGVAELMLTKIREQETERDFRIFEPTLCIRESTGK